MQLSNGQIRWQDATTLPAAQVALDDLSLEATAITWPFAQPLQFVGSAGISGAAARLEFSGFATDQAADVKVSLSDLPLAIASPYLAQFLQPRLVGQLAAEAAVQWTPASLKIHAGRLTVTDVALLSPAVGKKGADVTGSVKSASSSRSGKSTGAAPLDALASLKKLEVIDTLVDLGRQSVAIGKVSLLQPQIAVERNAERHWMAESWLKSGADKSDSRPWAVTVADIALDGGAFHFVDKAPSRPVALEVSNLKLGLKAFELNGKKPMPVTVMFRIRQPQGELGQLDYKGNLGLEPLSADGDLLATQIPVHAFEPYFGQALNVEVLRGEAGFKGRVKFSGSPAGPSFQVKGDAVLEEFRTRAPVAAEEMLSWKALSVRGLDVAMVPGTAVTVSVAETALTDFFARVLVNEGGRINLQDLIKSSAVPESPDAAKSAAFGSNPERAPDRNGLPAVVNIGPVSLINGKVFFSDHFIRPNYSANLSELNGRLSAFSNTPGAVSAAPQMADLELRGRAEGTASLEILGKLNPLAKPLALDLKAKVRDLELPPLSPYSVKYAGHGIERGKLSVDLAYAVKPDGQLEASNNIILNQLKFGEKVEGAPNSLPVKLAVALLADRNGVIDINLPVSGSLNDPQFSLGSIIFKVIINLVVKAVLSPFSLLASALGGDGDELSQVSFAAGSAVLGAEAKAGLDKVAKALADRPALKMTVVGTSNLDVEREAYKQEQLAALLQIEKRRVQVVGGSAGAAAPAAVASPAAAISAADRPALIREVYRRSDMPKPRNLIGIAKDIPVEEMEALLLANFAVTDDVMRDLALQRGVAVKDYLASKQLPLERLFLGNARAGEPAVKAGEPADTKAEAKSAAKWTPRAELNLATN